MYVNAVTFLGFLLGSVCGKAYSLQPFGDYLYIYFHWNADWATSQLGNLLTWKCAVREESAERNPTVVSTVVCGLRCQQAERWWKTGHAHRQAELVGKNAEKMSTAAALAEESGDGLSWVMEG